jgi:hypothetical protein
MVNWQNIIYIQDHYLIRSHKSHTLDNMAKFKQIFVK